MHPIGASAHVPRPETRWETLTVALQAGAPALLDEVGVMLRPVAPEYAVFVEQRRGDVAGAAETAMAALADHARLCLRAAHTSDAAAPLPPMVLSLFEEVGHNQWHEGFALRTLLSAYQVGGRVAWHHVAATALGVGLPATDLAALAEALFFLVDELCAASTDGYVAAQTASAAEREHRRDVLVDMLLSDRSDMAALQAAAAEAGWALPKRAAVIFVEHGNDAGRQALGRLGPRCLPVRNNGLPGAILPDADGPGRHGRLTAALRGTGATIGRSVALRELPASARVAELAAGLRRSGALTADPLFVDEHLDALIVHRDPRLLTLLCEQCLAPLANAAPGSRQILLDTLRCWLRNMGDQQSVAATLHVHRQTVRYRMTRLRELYGSALDDPDTRARMMLALAWEKPTSEPAPSNGTDHTDALSDRP